MHPWSVVRTFGPSDLGLPAGWAFAQMPTPLVLDAGHVRVFFASRHHYRPSIWFVDLEWLPGSRELNVLSPAAGPVWSPGPIGSWSQDGIYPSTVVSLNGVEMLFAIGWEVGSRSPLFRSSIGVADLDPEELIPREFPLAPILDRCPADPLLVTSPTIRTQADGTLHMLYVSGDRWEVDDSGIESRYSLRQAWSRDGMHWDGRGTMALPLSGDLTHIGRTCFRGDGADHLVTCVTTTDHANYRLHWATRQGPRWDVGPPVGFESGVGTIACYPAIAQVGRSILMFGNAEDRGASGFTVAIPVAT
jgi:hypothetical protein